MADYGETHVEAIQRYMRLRELGFPPVAIRKLLEAKEGAPFPVVPGITLVVDPNLLHRRAATEPILTRLKKILSDIFEDPKNDKSRSRKHD